MVTTPKSSLLGGPAASFEPISPEHRLFFRALLGRGVQIRAAPAHFHSPPKVRSVPGRSPPGHRPNRAFAVERASLGLYSLLDFSKKKKSSGDA